MNNRQKHKVPSPLSARNANRQVGANNDGRGFDERVMFAAGWLVLYAVLYFLTPLTSAASGSPTAMLRGTFWAWLFLPDQVVSQWFEDVSIHALTQRATILAIALVILAVAWSAGSLCLRLCATGGSSTGAFEPADPSNTKRGLSALERCLFSVAVGLNLISLLTLIAGLCNALRFELFVSVIAAVAVCAAIPRWRTLRGTQSRSTSDERVEDTSARATAIALEGNPSKQSARWLWLGAPFALVIVLSSMLPPVDFDVREYHLQAPKEFFEAGRISYLPHNVYANMPLGTEMLSLLGMVLARDWWVGALAGKTVVGLFAPLTALALWAAGKRVATPMAGVVAALTYISTPWVALVSTQGLVEGAVGFFLFMALLATLLWRQQSLDAVSSSRMLALAGFLAGGAISVKYPAVLFCALPIGLWIGWVALARRRFDHASRASNWQAVAKPLAVYASFCLLGCGLWFAKNAALTGNPTYPLLYRFFDGETRTPQKEAQWTQAHSPPNYQLQDLLSRAADITLTSDWLSPVAIPLAALALVARSSGRRLAWWLAGYFGWVFATWWLFTHRVDRFWVPVLPVVALAAGLGVTWNVSKSWRRIAATFMAVGLVFSFTLLVSGQLIDNRYFADLDVLRSDPQRVNPWHDYLNEHQREVTGVLLVGDAQPFDLTVPAVYNTVFDDCIFEQLSRDRTAGEVRTALLAKRISHVYVAWNEIQRYRLPGNYGITDFLQPLVFESLVTAGVLEPVETGLVGSGSLFRVVPGK